MMASLDGDVYRRCTRYSPAAMKSSNTFCFFSFIPASCHAWPYSPPPRRLAVAHTPPSSSHAGTSERKVGFVVMSKPPYAYNMVGFVPSSAMPRRCVMNIGTRVPSFDG